MTVSTNSVRPTIARCIRLVAALAGFIVTAPVLVAQGTTHVVPTRGDTTRTPADASRWKLDLQWAIGPGSAQTPHEFGRLADIAVDRRGRLHTLDNRFGEVRVFDDDGKLVAAVGQLGRLPGEFSVPDALTLDDSGTMVVADRRTQRLTVFRSVGQSYALRSTSELPRTVEDMCQSRGTLFVHTGWEARANGGVIERFVDGRAVRAFGAWFASDNEGITGPLSSGRIVCVGDRIVYAPQLLGWVAIYGPDGLLQHRVQLPGFVPPEVTESERGISFDFYPADGADIAFSLTSIDDGPAVLVQVARRFASRRSPLEFPLVRTYQLDVERGTLRRVSDSLPPIFAVRKGQAYSVEQYPSITVRKFRITESAR